jgi:hypothetical protein
MERGQPRSVRYDGKKQNVSMLPQPSQWDAAFDLRWHQVCVSRDAA